MVSISRKGIISIEGLTEIKTALPIISKDMELALRKTKDARSVSRDEG